MHVCSCTSSRAYFFVAYTRGNFYVFLNCVRNKLSALNYQFWPETLFSHQVYLGRHFLASIKFSCVVGYSLTQRVCNQRLVTLQNSLNVTTFGRRQSLSVNQIQFISKIQSAAERTPRFGRGIASGG